MISGLYTAASGMAAWGFGRVISGNWQVASGKREKNKEQIRRQAPSRSPLATGHLPPC